MPALVVTAHVCVHEHSSPVGTCHGVACEGIGAEFESLLPGMMFGKIYILRCKHGLGCHIVGIHAFPSARQCAPMEYHLQAVPVGIHQDVLIEFHRLLFVASEEVHLDACYSVVRHPFHLSLPGP